MGTIRTKGELAKALGVSSKRLNYILYVRRDRTRYVEFSIPKRSGSKRIISAPPEHLLWLQRRLLAVVEQYFDPKPCVEAFRKEHSIVSHASWHCRRRLVLTVDIKDFFPSIHIGRVIGVFQKEPFLFLPKTAEVAAQICCDNNGVLPQGGAMSPVMSNIICRGLDNDILSLASKHKLRYSRYADDLTVSTNRLHFPEEVLSVAGGTAVAGEKLQAIVKKHSFELNSSKTRFRSRSRRQEVTGLTVNQFVNVDRVFVTRLGGALRDWERHGLVAAANRWDESFKDSPGSDFSAVIRGRISYLSMVRGKEDFIVRRLSRRYNRLSSNRICIPSIAKASPCGMTSLPVSWSAWSSRYSTAVLMIVFVTKAGDERCGTAFHIGNGQFATARHNVYDPSGDVHDGLHLSSQGSKYAVCAPALATHGPNCKKAIDVAIVKADNLLPDARVPTQLRLPELGEPVAALGFPRIPQRNKCLVLHTGTVEALPVDYHESTRFVQVSFQSGGGLSGGCLIDRSGHLLGVMIENVFMTANDSKMAVPPRPYGQAVAVEHLDDVLHETP